MSLVIYLHPHRANLGVLQLFTIKLWGKEVQSDNSAAELLREGKAFFQMARLGNGVMDCGKRQTQLIWQLTYITYEASDTYLE